MSANWKPTKLGEILTKSDEWIDLKPDETYRQVTVRLWGKGVTLRGEITGAEIAATRQCVVHARQFIASRIDARNGAFGLIPDSLEGAIVTSDFPVFALNETRMLPEYLHWLSKTGSFVELCKAASEGTTNRVRLKEDRFLALEIPLPPVTEQRRIVARIEQLAAQIEEARRLRHQADEEANALISSALHHVFAANAKDWRKMPMPEAVEINDRQVDPRLPEYARLPHISGENMESVTCKLLPYRTAEEDGVKSSNYLFSPGAILYSKIRPYLRKAVLVDFQGVCSADIYPVKVTNDDLDPRFVMWSLVAGPFTDYANTLSGRTRMPKLNRKQFFAFELAYPEKTEQRRIVGYLDGLAGQVVALARLQSETAAALDALLPSILDKAFKGEL
jgi:type I restriction enzyme S subunit